MLRTTIFTALGAVALAGQTSAETIELHCRQEVSEVYSMGRTGMMSMTYDQPLDVAISLDTETDRVTLDQSAGMFDVGDEQVLIMVVSETLREVWDIDRATGRANVMAYVVDEPRTVFVRREAHCNLPVGLAP